MTITKYRTVLFPVLMLAGLALLAEALAYTAWHIRNGSVKLEEYQALKISARSYRYHGDLGVVLPFPEVEIIVPTSEFTDRFLTHRLPGLPGGFFDDGLDEEADVLAVAIGDSFTRGVGSTDPEAYGWVERVERSLGWIDIVNLGNSGTGQLQQFYFYDRVAPYLSPTLVIINFFSGGDFLDNTDSFDWNQYLASLPAGSDPSLFVTDAQAAMAYNPTQEALLRFPLWSYSAWAITKIGRQFNGSFATPAHIMETRARFDSIRKERADLKIPTQMVSVREQNLAAEVDEFSRGGFTFRLWNYQKQRDEADLLAQHSADLINRFYEKERKAGREVFIIIHPSKEEVYLPIFGAGPEEVEIDRARESLKTLLDTNLVMLDLTDNLRLMAKKSDQPLYHAVDGHYTIQGYGAAAQAIEGFLSEQAVALTTSR